MADNIDITQVDVQNAITFLEQFLTDKLPNVDFGPGTANRDIAINSIALTVAYLRQEIYNVRNRQSLKTLSELPADEALDAIVDEILSNWFINRKIGKKSRGVVTLYFSTNDIGTIYVTNEDTINKNNTLSFNVKEGDKFITRDNLTKSVSNTGSIYYTTTLTVECSVEGSYNLEPGTFESWSIASPYLYRIENLSKFTGGEGIESTADLLIRSETALTVRDLNTARSITTVLTEEFSQVEAVTAVGYGDPEMQRDLVLVNLSPSQMVYIHRGSMMDIWVKFPVEYAKKIIVTPVTAVFDSIPKTYFMFPAEPVLRINSLKDNSVSPAANVAYTLGVEDINLNFSSRQVVYVFVSSLYSNKPLELSYDTVIGYSEVQTFVEDEHNRILVADPVIKSLHPMYLKFDLRYTPTSLVLDTNAAKDTIRDFINSFDINQELSVSAVASKFFCTYSDYIKRVEYPLVIVGKIYLSTGEIIETAYTDRLEVPERYERPLTGSPKGLYGTEEASVGSQVVYSNNVQLSNRTCRYVLPEEDITITAV